MTEHDQEWLALTLELVLAEGMGVQEAVAKAAEMLEELANVALWWDVNAGVA